MCEKQIGTKSELPDNEDPIFNEEFIALQAAAFEKYEQQNQKVKEFEQDKEREKDHTKVLHAVKYIHTYIRTYI